MENNFSRDWGVWGWDGFRMIQVHYIHCALYFYYYCISCGSYHQALDAGGWGPLQEPSRVTPSYAKVGLS